MRQGLFCILTLVPMVLFAGTNSWNNPHLTSNHAKVRHSAFSGPPKTLDPARSYSSDEWPFINQIYEPLLQYHYLKRPYVLEPLTTISMPKVTYFNQRNQVLPNNTPASQVAYSVYDIQIKPNIVYQPHPAFAKHNKQFR